MRTNDQQQIDLVEGEFLEYATGEDGVIMYLSDGEEDYDIHLPLEYLVGVKKIRNGAFINFDGVTIKYRYFNYFTLDFCF